MLSGPSARLVIQPLGHEYPDVTVRLRHSLKPCAVRLAGEIEADQGVLGPVQQPSRDAMVLGQKQPIPVILWRACEARMGILHEAFEHRALVRCEYFASKRTSLQSVVAVLVTAKPQRASEVIGSQLLERI